MAARIEFHLYLLIALALCACDKSDKSDKNEAADVQVASDSDPENGHRTGLANANAMIENAERCEPARGPGELAACRRACELNHSNSCANWGRFLEANEDVGASALYHRSCQGGSGIGCEAEARLSKKAGQSEASALFLTARNYHRVHCSQGYARSCSQLAELLEQGLGGPVDAATARSYRRRACLLGPGSDC